LILGFLISLYRKTDAIAERGGIGTDLIKILSEIVKEPFFENLFVSENKKNSVPRLSNIGQTLVFNKSKPQEKSF
jgi:hypothetical protein